MPIGAKDGDFSTVVINGRIFANYVIKVSEEGQRSTLYSLSIELDETENPVQIKKVLDHVFGELKEASVNVPSFLNDNIKQIYELLNGRKTTIEITKEIKITVKTYTTNKEDDEKDSLDKRLEEELW